MCNSKTKSSHAVGLAIDGRPVLQPAGNRVAALEASRPLKKTLQKSISLPTSFTKTTDTFGIDADTEANFTACANASPAPPNPSSPPASPKSKLVKRGNDPNGLSPSADKPRTPKTMRRSMTMGRKKAKNPSTGGHGMLPLESNLFSSDRAPGSIAAAQREQASLMYAQRKMKIAHYGRTPAKLEGKVAPVDSSPSAANISQEEKRCSFITHYSDPIYVAYHDEEWGVPVHDDKMLFELLVLSGAQVGSDWTTILKKRSDFREAFAGFDAEVVSKFTEKQMAFISREYGLDLGRIRGVVDNANRILEVRKEFGSLDKYMWMFVNHKPITTNYKSCRKIPVKTSKSESISKDLVRRGFRLVGPTVVHSFMQAAGLTNDHLVTCPRHHHCSSLSTPTH